MFSVQGPPWGLALRLLAVLCLLACPRIGTAAGAPTISGYAATNPRGVAIFSAPPGAPLLIEGANLGSSGTVAFGGIPAPTPASWSPTELLVTVPAAFSYPFTGPVTVTVDGQTARGPAFTITPPPPPPPPPPPLGGAWSVVSLPQQPGEVMAPVLLAVDGAGSVYVADYSNGGWFSASARIQKRDPQGHWSVLASDGTGIGQVDYLEALAADAAGNLYVLDWNDTEGGRLQQRDAQGHWSVLAAEDASALAVDAAGNLYVADGSGIRKRDPQGHWLVLATQGASALTVDAVGNLYVTDGNEIRRRDVQGHWSVLATQGSALGQVSSPEALAADAAGNLYVADRSNTEGDRLQQRDVQGTWSLIAAEGDAPGQVSSPEALAADAAGNLYVADYGADSGRIQQRDTQGHWSFLATRGEGPGQMIGPAALAVDRVGNLYVADQSSTLGRIQQRDPQGNWSVLLLLGPQLPLWNPFDIPVSLAVDAAGNLYVAEAGDAADAGPDTSRIQRRDPQGHSSVLATAGGNVGQVHQPRAMAVDAAGNLYVAEAGDENDPSRGADRIQRRDAQGHWSVIATEGSAAGQVRNPRALAVDAAGNLYVAQADRITIQRRDVQGHWSVIDTQGQVGTVNGLAVDAAGNLYVTDNGNFEVGWNILFPTFNRVQKRDGQGQWSATNHDAAVGQFSFPVALAVDGAGHLYVAEDGNSRVLRYAPDGGP